MQVTGDVLADVLLSTRDRLPEGGEQGEYVLATAHRNYNTDSPERLGAVLACLRGGRAARDLPAAPAHPQEPRDLGPRRSPPTSRCATPVTYTEMLTLERDAVAIATDSGGVQREAYLWGVPCITMREETEWIETVSTGWNTLVGVDAEQFRAALGQAAPAASARRSSATATPPERIAELTVAHLERQPGGLPCLSN